jgi:hypothetical protein
MWKRYGSCQDGPWDGRSKLLCCRWLSPFLKYIKFRRQGITQKKTYNIENAASVWNRVLQYVYKCLKSPASAHMHQPCSLLRWTAKFRVKILVFEFECFYILYIENRLVPLLCPSAIQPVSAKFTIQSNTSPCHVHLQCSQLKATSKCKVESSKLHVHGSVHHQSNM